MIFFGFKPPYGSLFLSSTRCSISASLEGERDFLIESADSRSLRSILWPGYLLSLLSFALSPGALPSPLTVSLVFMAMAAVLFFGPGYRTFYSVSTVFPSLLPVIPLRVACTLRTLSRDFESLR